MERVILNLSLIRKLNNTEHDYLNRSLSQICLPYSSRIPVLSPVIVNYRSIYIDEDMIYKLSTAMEETQELVRLDEQRDYDYMRIMQLVNSELYSIVPEKANAAKQLAFLLKKYKRLDRRPYGETTDLIINMLQDLDADPYSDWVSLLGIKPLITILEVSNEAFHELYMSRSLHKTKLKQLGTMREIRKKVDEVLKQLVDQINAVYYTYRLQGGQLIMVNDLKELMLNLSSAIDHTAEVYYRRVNTEKPQPEEPDPVTPTPPPPSAPTFRVFLQEINSDNEMELRVEDHEHFLEICKDAAFGTHLQLSLDGSWENRIDFPFCNLICTEELVLNGFSVYAPSTSERFEMPFRSLGLAVKARLQKQDWTVIHLSDVMIPAMEE